MSTNEYAPRIDDMPFMRESYRAILKTARERMTRCRHCGVEHAWLGCPGHGEPLASSVGNGAERIKRGDRFRVAGYHREFTAKRSAVQVHSTTPHVGGPQPTWSSVLVSDDYGDEYIISIDNALRIIWL